MNIAVAGGLVVMVLVVSGCATTIKTTAPAAGTVAGEPCQTTERANGDAGCESGVLALPFDNLWYYSGYVPVLDAELLRLRGVLLQVGSLSDVRWHSEWSARHSLWLKGEFVSKPSHVFPVGTAATPADQELLCELRQALLAGLATACYVHVLEDETAYDMTRYRWERDCVWALATIDMALRRPGAQNDTPLLASIPLACALPHRTDHSAPENDQRIAVLSSKNAHCALLFGSAESKAINSVLAQMFLRR